VLLNAAQGGYQYQRLLAHAKVREQPNAILTPRMVGQSREAYTALHGAAVENVRLTAAGQVPRYLCDPDVISRWRGQWDAALPSPPQVGEGGIRRAAPGSGVNRPSPGSRRRGTATLSRIAGEG
jgi:hypothetical protein